MEIGRARLPSLAPDWTDHNAHDPGITLMELLAWTAEAQLFSLSRVRRDERTSYAALLGISPTGTRGASGLIWPDHLDPNSPVMTFTGSDVILQDTVINLTDSQNPTFRPVNKLLWVPGRIEKLETRGAGLHRTDHTVTNERGSFAFLPFGERSGRRDVLVMTFECRDKLGLWGRNRQETKSALWPIGVLVAPPTGGTVEPATSARTDRSSLVVALVTDEDRFDLPIVFDSTQGFLTTGALLLDLDNVTGSPKRFTIELRSPSGFPRPPRVLRIGPNVIPILQGHTISGERYESQGMPNWSIHLEVPGLRFATGEEPVIVEVSEPNGVNQWNRCDHLFEHGPHENVYEFDATVREVTFGNGVNGRIPPAGSEVFVSYSVSEGEMGNVARNRKWKVTGIAGTFGINPDPITGGAAAFDWVEQRREARRRARDDHALVSSDDIAAAAKALPLLEVARAWVPEPDTRAPRTGALTLVALRSRSAGNEPEQPPETSEWLEAIRRRLAPRMPLASRLVVVAPRYVEFSIQAVLEANLGTNPSEVKERVEKELKKRLAIVGSETEAPFRQPGVPLAQHDVMAWMRATEGVKRVVELHLRSADGQSEKKIAVPRSGLPRWNSNRSNLDVRRPDTGRPR
jgi:hypothetical protein